MPAPRRLLVPIGDRSRPGRRSRRLSAVVVVATVLALGGAVAGVYTTGVSLGARLAPGDTSPRDEPRPRGEGRAADPPSSDATTTAPPEPGSSLPDRAQGPGSTTSTTPVADGGGGPNGGGAGAGGGAGSGSDEAPVGRYPGLWPYATWDEVRHHRDSGDTRFADPVATALQFAREVVGVTAPRAALVTQGATDAAVDVTAGGRSTRVELTRAVPDGSTRGAPWSVTGADGPVALDAPATTTGATVGVSASGAPGVVGVHDRRSWRGLGVAPAPGAPVAVRIDPGLPGPAMVVAFDGDPRQPLGFTVRRVTLAPGAGATVAPAPADPVAATRALVAAVDRGDVGSAWELLTPATRSGVLDWRGLAGRVPALRESLALFDGTALTSTTVATPAGSVAVVAPAVTALADADRAAPPLAALVLVPSGGSRVAGLDPAAVSWSGPDGPEASVVAAGPTRPVALVVDGTVWASGADGAAGLAASAADLAPGPHLAVAVVADGGGGVTAASYLFSVEASYGPVAPPGGGVEPTTPTPGTARSRAEG